MTAARPRFPRVRRGDTTALAALATGAVLLAAYFLLLPPDLQELAYQVPGMLAVVAVLAGIRRNRPERPAPWFLLAAGLAMTTTGDWTWVVLERVFGIEPFPSVADAFYLGGLGLTGIAIVALVRRRIPDGDRAGLIDALIVTVGAALLSWTFLLQPIAADGEATLAETAFAMAYPLLDLFILGILVRIGLAPGQRPLSQTLLLAALGVVLVSDVVYAGLVFADAYHTGHPVEIGWLAHAPLYAAAALHPSMRRLGAPTGNSEVSFGAVRLVLLASASLVAPAVLVYQWLSGAPIDGPVIAAASSVLFLLVIARLSGVVSDLRSNLHRRQALESELKEQALHDPLTGLANRTLFAERLDAALARADQSVAVLFLDLDDFKTINDTHGHQAGDDLLRAVAAGLRRSVRDVDTVARLGGDEFAVLVEQDASEAFARQLAERLLRALRRPMRVAGQDRSVGASIGITLGHGRRSRAEQLMSEADIAMYVAKGEGKGTAAMFDSRIHASVVQSIGLRDDLAGAIRDRQFELHYQPIVDLETGALAGVEALVRWRHPVRGLLPPQDFIGLSESSGAIVELGRWIFSEACRQAAGWRHTVLADGRFMSINLSTVQLRHPGFTELVVRTIDERGADPNQLVVELTESLSGDRSEVAAALGELHELGIRLAVDDFGSGFASMEQLARVPFAIIKIDRSLIETVDRDLRSESVVTGIADLGRRLGAVTIAEGIERPEQLAPLRAMGCTLGQGYYLAAPVPPGELEEAVHAAHRAAGRLVLLPGARAPSPLPDERAS